MALTKASALHYWDARYGIRPIVGGEPRFSRSGEARIAEQSGLLRPRPINTPRFGWDSMFDPQRVAKTERRSTLLLELARTNEALYSEDFANAAWVKSNVSVTFGVSDPAGGMSASTITATGADGQIYRHNAVGADQSMVGSIYIRRRDGSGQVSMMNPAGNWVVVAITTEWQRVQLTAPSTNRSIGILFGGAAGEKVDIYGAQLEPLFATSYIPTTTAAVTRPADSSYWDYPPAPNELMVYVRFVEKGSALAGARILQIGSAADAVPKFLIYGSGGGVYRAHHFNSAGNGSATLAAGPALGDTVELVGVLFADGSTALYQSINGAAVTSAGPSSALALASSWSDTRLWLNSVASTGVGANRFAEVKVVKYADVVGATAQARMDELRAFELGASGDLLAA